MNYDILKLNQKFNLECLRIALEKVDTKNMNNKNIIESLELIKKNEKILNACDVIRNRIDENNLKFFLTLYTNIL